MSETRHRSQFDLAHAVASIDRRLETVFPAGGPGPQRLTDAARYALLAPGKRVRGVLTLLVADAGGRPWTEAIESACAIELIHAASLIVDDLPCMDDARLRRGASAAHLAHGEGTALLAAFALMNAAFATVAQDRALDDAQKLAAIESLTLAIGPRGLTGGQEDDLNGSAVSADDVRRVHEGKTGSLFRAAAELGAIVAGLDEAARASLGACGMKLGLAFQAYDDLIDLHASEAVALKDVRQDQGGVNLAAIIGSLAARDQAERTIVAAKACLKSSGVQEDHILRFVDELANKMRAKSAGVEARVDPQAKRA